MQAKIHERARYPFLARPPPPQKKQPTRPPPSPPIAVLLPLPGTIPPSPPLRRRASGIAAWAALVQPGSPVPRSPHRRLSNSSSRRGSLSRTSRRTSISHSRAPSGSLGGLIHAPASAHDVDVNLSALGYTSVFVHVPPKTPSTPSHLVQTALKTPMTPLTATVQSSLEKKVFTTRTIKRFRSLGILRPRAKSASRSVALPSPTKATVMGVRARAELISKRKKAKYAHVRPPPPLSNEIALMQFADGGSVEANIKRVMEAQARAAGNIGVADVYRDGKGGLWWDRDEEVEYAHLLGGNINGEAAESQWVKFGGETNEDDVSPKTGLVDLAELKRESMSTQNSDFDSKYLVLPAEETQCGPEDVVLSFSVPPKSPFKDSPIVPGLSVLSLPSRPRRAARHLHKPEFLVDVAAFGPRSPGIQIGTSPQSPHLPSALPPTPRTPRTPRSARFSSTFVLPPTGGARKKVKRRPAPLKLAPLTSANAGWQKVDTTKTPTSVAVSRSLSGSSPGVIANARREFVEASFAPKPVLHHVTKISNTGTDRNVAEEHKPQRGKIILASLDPSDDMSRCKEWAEKMGVDIDVDASVNKSSGNVARKKRLGFGGLFGRKL